MFKLLDTSCTIIIRNVGTRWNFVQLLPLTLVHVIFVICSINLYEARTWHAHMEPDNVGNALAYTHASSKMWRPSVLLTVSHQLPVLYWVGYMRVWSIFMKWMKEKQQMSKVFKIVQLGRNGDKNRVHCFLTLKPNLFLSLAAGTNFSTALPFGQHEELPSRNQGSWSLH